MRTHATAHMKAFFNFLTDCDSTGSEFSSWTAFAFDTEYGVSRLSFQMNFYDSD